MSVPQPAARGAAAGAEPKPEGGGACADRQPRTHDGALRASPPWPLTRLYLECEECGHPISKQQAPGHVAVNRRAALDCEVARLRWSRQNPGVDLRHGPPLVKWRVVHSACDTQRSDDDFRISATHLSTDRRLMREWERIGAKHWAHATDWPALLRHMFMATARHNELDATAAARRHAEAAKRAAPQDDP